MPPTNATGAEPFYAGAIKGEFNVDQNGNAVYSIPIQVPPGTGGLAPSLSLVYHSALNNGMIGPGWSLQGLSAIFRTSRNPAQDGVDAKEPLRYDSRDRMVLDGLRLVAVSGDYWAPEAVYHTEIESWKRVRASGEGFACVGKNGLTHEFGLTPDSRIRVAGEHSAIRAWLLSRVVDRCGNFVTFHYVGDAHTTAYYPARIEYTGNQNLKPARLVEFVYENRSDVQPRYESGCAVHETRRLKQIETSVEGTPVLTWTLDFEQSSASGRSRLANITLADAQRDALPATRFEWLDLDKPKFAALQSLPDPDVPFGIEIIPFDLNGSGRRDLLMCGADEAGGLLLRVMLAGDGGHRKIAPQPFPTLQWSEGCIYTADIDGDGATELIHAGSRDDGTLSLTLLHGARNGSGKLTLGPVGGAGPRDLPFGGNLVPIDIDGDGRIDLVYCTSNDNGFLRLQPLHSTGSSFTAGAVINTTLLHDANAPLMAVDFTGSGLSGLLRASSEERDGRQRLSLQVFNSTGKTFELAGREALAPGVELPFGGALIPARLKDDSQDDLVYAVSDDNGRLIIHTLFGTGVDYRPAGAAPRETDLQFRGSIFPMAMRGAGLSELLVHGYDDAGRLDLRMLRWNGTHFLPPEPCLSDSGTKHYPGGWTLPADATGNGKTDLILVGSRDDGKLELGLFSAPPAAPDRICTITEGLKGRYEISYRPLTDPAVYSKDELPADGTVDGQARINAGITGSVWRMTPGATVSAGKAGSAYSLPTRQFAEYVVAEHNASDGRGNRYRSEYHYRGCRIDPNGRGWLGLSSREVRDIEAGVTRRERYHQMFPATASLAASSLLQSSDGATLQREVYSYQQTAQSRVHTHLVSNIRTELFTPGKTTAEASIVEANGYDEYGNVTLRSLEPSGSTAIHTHSTWSNDEEKWRLGELSRRTVSADVAGTKILKDESFVYDPKTGRVSESGIFDDEHNRWLATNNRYDEFGNVTSVETPAGLIRTIEYDSRHHTFPVRETTGRNGATEYEYEAAFGQKIAITDANGARETCQLDGLGRVIELRGMNPRQQLVPLSRTSWGTDGREYYSEQSARTDWESDAWTWEREYLDGLGRVYRRTAHGADGSRDVVVERSLDSAGQPLRESLPRFAGENPHWIEYTYDVLGRVTRRSEPADNGRRVTEISYPALNSDITTITAAGLEARTTTNEFRLFGDNGKYIVDSSSGAGV